MQEMQKTQFRSLGQENPLEEEMAARSSILAWEIPWTEEPGWLQSMGSQSLTPLNDWAQHMGLRFSQATVRAPTLGAEVRSIPKRLEGSLSALQELSISLLNDFSMLIV